MTVTVLYLDFIDELGKRRSISIENPRDDVLESEVSQAMDLIIQNDIFEDKLVAKEGARIVTRTTDELEVA